MADNVSNASVSTDVIAADDVSGVKFQQVKISLGQDGQFDGNVSKEMPLPVIMGSREVILVNNVEIGAGETSFGEYLVDNISFSTTFNIATATATSAIVALQMSNDSQEWITVYKDRYNLEVGFNNIKLPLLPSVRKYVRYSIECTLPLSATIRRWDGAITAAKLINLIEEDLSIAAVGNTSSVFEVLGIKNLIGILKGISSNSMEYIWEGSSNGEDWITLTPAKTANSTSNSVLVISNPISLSKIRLKVVSLTGALTVGSLSLFGGS